MVPTWYTDADGDGFGLDGTGVEACTAPAETSDAAGDCDDGDRTRFPGAAEVCGDGVVNDCDGTEADAQLACPYAWPTRTTASSERAATPAPARPSPWGTSTATASTTSWWAPREDVARAATTDWSSSRAPPPDGSTLNDAAPSIAIGSELGWDLNRHRAGRQRGRLRRRRDWRRRVFSAVGYARVYYGGPGFDFAAGADGRLVADLSQGVGHAVAGVGDVDGDALGDILVGHPTYTSDERPHGAVYLLAGPADSGNIRPATVWANLETLYSDFGASVATAGDVDGDGRADLLMGGPNLESPRGMTGGAVLVQADGVTEGILDPADADAIFAGNEDGDAFGAVVAGAGDMDGDGLDDVLIGAPRVDDTTDRSVGAVYLFLGTATGLVEAADATGVIVGDGTYTLLGSSISTAGDLDFDGVDDILVGAPGYYDEGPSETGKVHVFAGGFTGVLDTADATFRVEDATLEDGTGASVAAGDVNGDGLQDLLLGQPGMEGGAPRSGGLSIVFGGTAY